MSGNLMPSLLPRIADPLWFNVDQPVDDDAELTALEKEHKNQVDFDIPNYFILHRRTSRMHVYLHRIYQMYCS